MKNISAKNIPILNPEVPEEKNEDLELSEKEKKKLAVWVGEKILESQEKIEKTLEELSTICNKNCDKEK